MKHQRSFCADVDARRGFEEVCSGFAWQSYMKSS